MAYAHRRIHDADAHILERYRSSPDQGIRADPRYARSPVEGSPRPRGPR